MVRIRRFGVIRTATVAATMYAVIILVGTLLIGLPITLLAGAAGRTTGDGGTVAAIVSAGLVGTLLFGLFGAVAYAIVGWIMTAIACVIYNVVAGWVGGIEVQLESTVAPAAPQWGGPYGGYAQGGYPQAQPGYPQPGYAPGPGYPQGAGGPPQVPPPQAPPPGFGPG